MPKQEKYLPVSMSEEEVERLLNSPNLNIPIERRDKAMIEVLYATGIRISELINLKLIDIDINRSVLKVLGKGSKERLVPYGEKAADSINLYLKDRKHLKSKEIFLSNRGTRITRGAFWQRIKIYIKRENLKSLKIIAKNPDILIIENLSKFINKINLEVKISNKDIILIQAFDQERNYSESAVFTRSTGEFIHEITKKINSDEKEKDISFYSCKKNNQDT